MIEKKKRKKKLDKGVTYNYRGKLESFKHVKPEVYNKPYPQKLYTRLFDFCSKP
jgi:hypothetical protein